MNRTRTYSKLKHLEFCLSTITKTELKDLDKLDLVKITEFQADNKIQVSARKSTNNNPESKTKGENDDR